MCLFFLLPTLFKKSKLHEGGTSDSLVTTLLPIFTKDYGSFLTLKKQTSKR